MERRSERKRSVELMVGLFVVLGFAALLFTACLLYTSDAADEL